MTTYLALKYGSYVYDPTTDMPDTFNDTLKGALRTAVPPSVDGEFTAGGLVGSRRFTAKGTLTIAPSGNVQADALTFRNKRDALYAAHLPGLPQPFWMDSDRYVNAEVESLPMIDWRQGMTHYDYEIGFYCADPYFYQGDGNYNPLSQSIALAVGGASVPSSNTSQVTTPTTAPTLTAASGSTALAAGTYTVGYTYRDAYGETQIGPTSNVTLTAGQQINVSASALPGGVTLANLYMSIAAGSAALAWVGTWNGGATSITALPASPNSTNVNVGGTVYALPTFSIPVTAATTGGLVYVKATGGGLTWAFQLAPTATGTYTVDCTRQRQRVTLSGVDTTNILTGVFPRLAGNAANTVVLGVSGGASVGASTVSWQNRWPNF